MRTLMLVVVLTFACKGKSNEKEKEAVKAAVVVPKVDVATVLAKDGNRLPYLLVVDDAGARVGAAGSWAELDAGDVKLSKKPMPLDDLDKVIREDFAMGRQPAEAVASADEYADSDGINLDLASLEDTTTRSASASQDDPPPPEEEDKPDDGADESGGTGTAMALEEGKMGKKDSDRAEGQYKMKKNQEDPVLARQRAIEQARAAGILGNPIRDFGPNVRPNEDGTPSRVSHVQGAVIEDGKLEPMRSLIFMSPTAKATKLIEAIRITDGAIAVSHGGKVRPLRLDFMNRGAAQVSDHWIEARVSAKSVVLEAVPDKPIEVSDLEKLAAVFGEVRKQRDSDGRTPVDVLVDPDVDVQRLIDVVVALDVAGARAIGMGPMPDGEQLARRGHRIPRVALGQPLAQGDLDKAVIRRTIKLAKPKILGCYTKALASDPELEGTVMTQFFITPKGNVASSIGSGVDTEVANCVAEVIRNIEFPKPSGGGGVQVNYPFTMRP